MRLGPVLALVVLAAPVQALELVVRHGTARHPIPFAPEGAAPLDALLARLGRGTPGAERMRRIMARLLAPAGLAEAARVLAAAPPGRARLFLVPDDSIDRLQVGETLELPDGRRHTVAPGDTLARIAARSGFAVEDLEDANRDRFTIWPHAAFEWVKGRRVASISVGARQLAADASDDDALQGLYHELAHVGDPNPCRQAHEHYGLDGKHYHDEILTPEAAFTEGLADWQASHVPGAWAGWVRARSLALRIEGTRPTADRYRWVANDALTALDMLSNETWVAILLARMESLAPGRDGLVAALRAVPPVGCRSAAAFLASYVRLFPGERPALAALVPDVLLGRLDPAGVEALLAGRLPGGARADAPPRPRDYVPSGRPMVVAAPDREPQPGFTGIRILGL